MGAIYCGRNLLRAQFIVGAISLGAKSSGGISSGATSSGGNFLWAQFIGCNLVWAQFSGRNLLGCNLFWGQFILGAIACGRNVSVTVNTASIRDFTPLYWAAFEGDDKIVRLLLDAGADVNNKYKRYDIPTKKK